MKTRESTRTAPRRLLNCLATCARTMKTAADENHWDLIFPRALRWTALACSLLAFAAAAFILNTMQRYAWRCGEPFRNDFTLYTVCAAIILGTQFLTWNRRSIPLDIARYLSVPLLLLTIYTVWSDYGLYVPAARPGSSLCTAFGESVSQVDFYDFMMGPALLMPAISLIFMIAAAMHLVPDLIRRLKPR